MTTVVMPQLGESVVEGTVVRWLVKPGQKVTRDEPLVEVATDKANSEIPAPSAGVITQLLAPEGAVVPVGAPLCQLDESGAGVSAASPAATASPIPTATPAATANATALAAPTAPARPPSPFDASPVARNVAQEHGVDLAGLQGSGPGGRITKADVLAAAGLSTPAAGLSAPAPAEPSHPVVAALPATQPPPARPAYPAAPALVYAAPVAPGAPRPTLPPPPSFVPGPGPIALALRVYKPPRYTPKDGDQVVPFDQRRRLISEHMVYSKATSPHVPCTAEVDLSNLSRLRDEWKRSKETGGKAPSYLVGVCKAAIQALAEFPRLNAVVQDESLILRKDINLGIAVETEKGLLVPVIRKANEKSTLGVARAIDELAEKGRTGKISADELSGGSFTVSNPGLKGNLFGAAIINQPQVGILRMGEIVKRPVVRALDGQDAIVIRPIMYLTLSYDHRVIDGVNGNGFLHRVKELLEAAQFTL